VNGPSGMIPPQDLDLETWSGGPVAQWDSRDNQFYPTSGHFANLSMIFSSGNREYQIYHADWNYYHSLGESIVLAFRGTLRISDGDVPFYALSQFGQRSDLRGYTNGKYRDRDLVAVQGEYRQRLTARWGFVVFAGVGEVVPSLKDLNTDDLLASGGVGLRFRLSKQNPVNLRFDWAYGKDGSATYVGINEAF
jgi:outer membrane protein assembly factor BamA